MEVRFEMKIENLDFVGIGELSVLFISRWFNLSIRKSAEKSKYYIHHTQAIESMKTSRPENLSLESDLFKFSRKWKKVCKLTFHRCVFFGPGGLKILFSSISPNSDPVPHQLFK